MELFGFVISLLLTWVCVVSGEYDHTESVIADLDWCTPLCLCLKSTGTKVKCIQSVQLYSILGFDERRIMKLQRLNFDPEKKLEWCTSSCLCHKEKTKKFWCTKKGPTQRLVQGIAREIAEILPYREIPTPSPTPEVIEEEIVEITTTNNLISTNLPPQDIDIGDVQKDDINQDNGKSRHENNLKKDKRRSKNKKKNRNKKITNNNEEPVQKTHEDASISPPFVRLEDYDKTNEMTITTEAPPSPSTVVSFTPEEVEILEPTEESQQPVVQISDQLPTSEEFPRQEAVAASPAVTAQMPPSRRLPPPPPLQKVSQDKLHNPPKPRILPKDPPVIVPQTGPHVLEVPLERKTVAGEVSQDLEELGEDVRQIKSNVVLNQRILLVTVGAAAVAMLG